MMNTKNKLLILDLDETLVHATKEPLSYSCNFSIEQYMVYKRPYLNAFLDKVKAYYKIAVWSSASDQYVEQVVANIFPPDYPLEFVWGRSKCTQQMDQESMEDLGYSDYYSHLNYSKILKKVKKKGFAKMEDILIIDDTPRKSKHNYGNAIYPTEFIGDPNDMELKLLLSYLIQIKEETNFRKIEKRNWQEQVLNANHNIQNERLDQNN